MSAFTSKNSPLHLSVESRYTEFMVADAKADFIRIEIKLGNTMLGMARTERGRDPEAATKAIANAKNALGSAKRFLPKLTDAPSQIVNELARGIEDLDAAIRAYENS